MPHITSIKVKGFESHEDTVLADLSPGLNAIVGLSQSGKSAIIRALKLVAYNDYDPKSLRVGCENCEVEVTTTNGKVKVTRGKKNLWEVTDHTGKTSYFDKIGKQILPQVSEILGFGLVKLGDIEMKVNIMDQLESHFMLAEFDGEDATGSLRAQVVDEISGLSGIEGLIRDVGLDNSRLTRETNQIEERLKEIALQVHDEQTLNREEMVLKKAGDSLLRYDENKEVVAAFFDIGTDHQRAKDDVERLERERVGLPDESAVMIFLSVAETAMADIKAISISHGDWSVADRNVSRLSTEVASLPDNDRAMSLAQQAQDALDRLERVETLVDTALAETGAVSRLQSELAALCDAEAVTSRLLVVEKSLERASRIGESLRQYRSQDGEVKRLNNELLTVEAGEELAAREYNEALSKVDVCPVTMKPISGECLKGARVPVKEKP